MSLLWFRFRFKSGCFVVCHNKLPPKLKRPPTTLNNNQTATHPTFAPATQPHQPKPNPSHQQSLHPQPPRPHKIVTPLVVVSFLHSRYISVGVAFRVLFFLETQPQHHLLNPLKTTILLFVFVGCEPFLLFTTTQIVKLSGVVVLMCKA